MMLHRPELQECPLSQKPSKPTQPGLPVLLRLGLVLFALALALPLAAYAINGASMRFSGDDFCYASVYRQHGFWGTQAYAYLSVSGYNGNRYSLNLASAAADLFGPAFSGALPALAILTLGLGLVWAFAGAARLIDSRNLQKNAWFVRYISAWLVVFFSLRLAPNLGQVLFWRTGMLTYLAPLIAGVLLAGFILSQTLKTGNMVIPTLVCLLGSFIAGGFSETSTAVQGAAWGLGLAGALILARRGMAWAWRLVWLMAACVLGALLAVLALYLSPINAVRMGSLPPHPGLWETITITLQSTLIFLYISVKVEWLPDLLLFLAFIGLSISYTYSGYTQSSRFFWKRWLFAGIVTGAATLILTVCAMLPFAYVQHGYPDPRSLVIPRFVLVLGGAAMGWLAGQAAAQILFKRSTDQAATSWMPRLVPFIILICLGLGSVYPLLTARDQASQAWHYQKWAHFWDARDLIIRQAHLEGRSLVKVVKLDHIIPDIAELSADPTYWINGCAAGYYGVTSISASLPGWDQAGP